MEGIKARLQVQYNSARSGNLVAGQKIYTGPIDVVRSLMSSLGFFRGVYRGYFATIICRMSNYAYFGPYELFRRKLAGTNSSGGQKKLSMGATVLAGAGAGICYWLACYPMDVVKNKIQAAPDIWPPKYSGFMGAAREVYRNQGVRGFFVGFLPCILRAVPANAAAFSCFEIAMHLLPE